MNFHKFKEWSEIAFCLKLMVIGYPMSTRLCFILKDSSRNWVSMFPWLGLLALYQCLCRQCYFHCLKILCSPHFCWIVCLLMELVVVVTKMAPVAFCQNSSLLLRSLLIDYCQTNTDDDDDCCYVILLLLLLCEMCKQPKWFWIIQHQLPVKRRTVTDD